MQVTDRQKLEIPGTPASRRWKQASRAASLTALAVCSTAFAHHSAAMFDSSKTVTLKGTVKSFQFTNPHSWLIVLVPGPDGQPVEWGFESEGPSTLMHVGILPKSFQPGDKVTVTASPMRDGRPAGSLKTVVMANGTVFKTRPDAPPAAATAAPKE